MKKPQPGVWGINLGQCALKAVRLQEIDGHLTATAFDYVEHPKILSQPDADPDQLTREALEKFLSHNTLRGDTVCISVPGQSGLARFVKLPPVEEKKIADIVRFEAKQQIPFNLDEVVWDFQKIGSGTVTDGFAMDTEIGLFAMKRNMINRYLEHFKDVNVEIHVIQMAPLALCNYAAFDLLKKELAAAPPAEGETPPEEESGCVCVLDLGTDSSNLVITDGNRIIWQRPIPIGGNHFTRALTKDLKLTFAKAEHLKRNATKSPDLKKILSALKPVLNDFVSEVQRSLGYFTNTHRDAQIGYMIGLGNAFRLPGLQRFLEEKLQLSVRKLQKMERLTGDTVLTSQAWTENILSFGVAYGLALQGMKRARLQTNLLPHEIRTERLIRAKKPWAVASAAALLIGLGSLVADAGLSFRAFAHPDVEAAGTRAKDVTDKAKDALSKFNQARSAAELEKKNVESIVSGQGEFRNWLSLMRFISETIPRPDGSNLPPDPKVRDIYWKNLQTLNESGDKRLGAKTGQDAFLLFEKRQQGLRQVAVAPVAPQQPGVRPERPKGEPEELGAGIDDLIQVNIEAIDSRYFDNVKGFWDRAQINPGNIFPDFQKSAPTGRAWVIEIRGYTFHHRERNFLLDTFISNLVRKAEIKPIATETPAPAPEGTKPGSRPPPPVEPVKPAEPDPKSNVPVEMRPVIGNITHVVLYKDRSSQRSDIGNWELIERSIFDSVGQGAGAPDPMGMVAPPPPPPPVPGQPPGQAQEPTGPTGRDYWKPIASGNAAGNQGGPPGGVVIRPPQPGAPPANDGPPHVRTEFVILFVWKEPLSANIVAGNATIHQAVVQLIPSWALRNRLVRGPASEPIDPTDGPEIESPGPLENS